MKNMVRPSQIQGTRSKKDEKLREKSVPYFQQESGPWRITIHSNVDLVFFNNLDKYDYVGKLPEQHFSVWMFSNPGDNILFLLKFNKARISEWNITILLYRIISSTENSYSASFHSTRLLALMSTALFDFPLPARCLNTNLKKKY